MARVAARFACAAPTWPTTTTSATTSTSLFMEASLVDRLRAYNDSGAEHGPPRAREEAGLDEERHRERAGHRLAVEALDGEPLAAAPAHVQDKRVECEPEPFLFGLAQGDERTAAALDEENCLAVQEDDLGTCDASGARTRSLRPRQRRSVRLRGIGRGEHERLGVVAFARAQLAQPLDRAAERELRAAEPLDEVAAAAGTERLERPQLAVDRAVAAGDPLAANAVPGDDALPFE